METLELADGDRLAYDCLGEGEPVLLILGTALSVGIWPRQFVEALARRHRVIVYDHRGMGQSSPTDRPVTAASLAGDAAALLDHLGLHAAHVVGWSLGSAVAQELALARPDLVASLLLYATWGRADGFAKALFAGLSAPWKQGDSMTGIAAFGVAMSPELLDSNEFGELAAQALQYYPQTAEQVAMTVRQFEAGAAHDTSDRLQKIAVPTTVVVGEQDLLTPPRLGRAVANAIPGATFAVVEGPGSSHGMMLERPQDWLELVLNHLKHAETM